jgi:phenylalanine-4-hydroxylase
MKQLYDRYTAEHQQVWNVLFERQFSNLQDKACSEHLQALHEMREVLHGNEIVHIDALSEALYRRNGWQIHIVPGLIPAADFLALLAEKKFCSSTWLRTMAQLDYLEEPDMFHDIFGHVPLLWNEQYADFVQQVGILGLRYKDNPAAIAVLERFYWFTIEFGLVQESGQEKIYGAGIISSFQETNSIYETGVNVRPFDLVQIVEHEFVKSSLQPEYFSALSLEALYGYLPQLESVLEAYYASYQNHALIV